MRSVGDIQRIDASEAIGIEENIARETPIIISGAVENWRVYLKWTPAALLNHLGAAKVAFRHSPTDIHPEISASGEFLQLDNQVRSLGEYLTLMSESPNVFLDANLVCLASRRGKVNQELAPLLSDVELPYFIREADVDTVGLWLSGKGVKTRLHYDRNGRNNFNAQIAGQKDFVLVPPDEFKKLYPFSIDSPIFNFTRVNNYDPDLDKFPLFSQVIGYQGTLREGDLLFLPAFWYHSFTHRGEFIFNINFWCDATQVRMTAVALRHELATILQTSALAAGISTDGSDERWRNLLRQVEQSCLKWTPQRATGDEVNELARHGEPARKYC